MAPKRSPSSSSSGEEEVRKAIDNPNPSEPLPPPAADDVEDSTSDSDNSDSDLNQTLPRRSTRSSDLSVKPISSKPMDASSNGKKSTTASASTTPSRKRKPTNSGKRSVSNGNVKVENPMGSPKKMRSGTTTTTTTTPSTTSRPAMEDMYPILTSIMPQLEELVSFRSVRGMLKKALELVEPETAEMFEEKSKALVTAELQLFRQRSSLVKELLGVFRDTVQDQ